MKVWFVVVCLFGATACVADGSSSVAVSFRVEPIMALSFGDNGKQVIDLAVNYSDIIAESSELYWTTNMDNMKIQIQSSLPESSQQYTLKVRAFSATSNATFSDWITVTEVPQTIINYISKEAIKDCRLEYQAMPKSKGILTQDFHKLTVIFTK